MILGFLGSAFLIIAGLKLIFGSDTPSRNNPIAEWVHNQQIGQGLACIGLGLGLLSVSMLLSRSAFEFGSKAAAMAVCWLAHSNSSASVKGTCPFDVAW